MSSERRILVLGVAALLTSACATRTSPQPPEFPSGGLVSRATPPPNPYSLQNVLEGVYDTSTRFGSNVVVHASQWGGLADGMKASVAILGYDHNGFAIMQPGCFTDTTVTPPVTRLVLEGYWRYLDESDPTPSSTGLIRLFVGPASIVEYVCGAPPWNPVNGPGDPRPAPTDRARLTGATGGGTDVPGLPIDVTWNRPRKSRLNADGVRTFLVGVHHGACQTSMNCGISENTPETAIMATQLQGEYMEIDIRLTKDQVPVFFHLGLYPGVVQGTYCTGMVEDYTYAELVANCRLRNGEIIPRVVDMLTYIYTRTILPTYLDIEDHRRHRPGEPDPEDALGDHRRLPDRRASARLPRRYEVPLPGKQADRAARLHRTPQPGHREHLHGGARRRAALVRAEVPHRGGLRTRPSASPARPGCPGTRADR